MVCAIQDQQLGTGHAVLVTEADVSGDIVVVCCGDAPLVPAALLQEVITQHQATAMPPLLWPPRWTTQLAMAE